MTSTAAPLAPSPQQNLFGICARVGADFGFDPLWLRLAFAGVLILNPVAVIAAYFALGAVAGQPAGVSATRAEADGARAGGAQRAGAGRARAATGGMS